MNLLTKVQKIRGFVVNYRNGKATVLDYYDDVGKVLICLHKGTEYSIGTDRVNLAFISDGTDKIIVPYESIEIYNRHLE